MIRMLLDPELPDRTHPAHRTQQDIMTDPAPSKTYSTRGGARIGWVNHSWPLASLSVDASGLTIATTMFGLFGTGRYHFTPSEVTRIERYGFIPILGEGIRVHHTVRDYPEKIVFWCRPASVLEGIASTGFPVGTAGGDPGIPEPKRGFPLRIWPLAVVVLLWNLLISYEMFLQPSPGMTPGPLSLSALILFFLTSMGVLRSGKVQEVFLRPGRTVGEVRPLFLLTATVTGVMALVFGIMFIAGGLR